MKNNIRAVFSNPVISGSSIVFVGSFAANIINYFFNLVMGRMLSVEDYGILLSLTSVFILFGIGNQAFINSFSKFSARYFATNNTEGLHNLYVKGLTFLLVPSVLLLIILVALSPIIANFLHISNILLVGIIIFTIFVSLLSSMPTGILQGKLQFVLLSALQFVLPIIKLCTAVLLISFGLSVVGAVSSIAIANTVIACVGFFVVYRYYPKYGAKTKEFARTFKKDFFTYSYSTIIASIAITLLMNTDIILVRHFFDEITSGQYAALSLMGKAIFYFTSPVQFVFFPIIAQKKEKMERLFPTLLLTLGIIGGISGLISLVYFIAPNIVLTFFFPGSEYKILTQYLGFFSVYVLLFSLVMVLNNFFLSIGHTVVSKYILLGSIAQIGLIIMFHATLFQVISILLVTNGVLFIALLTYFFIHGKD